MIQQLRSETGAKIKIQAQIPGCDERVVVIGSPDDPESEWAAAQQALLRVHECINDADIRSAAGQVMVRSSRIVWSRVRQSRQHS